jgi:hypothetical protein
MDGCSLLALVACFNLSGFYVGGGVSAYDEPLRSTEVMDRQFALNGTDLLLQTSYNLDFGNVYGHAAIGYEFGGRRLTFSLRASHDSSIESGDDRGVNSISFGFKWRPFAR